ncbi:MAG TPA: SDR family oxidoreductase [Anaeromyxobacter sp.]|nr:SDR family oxidoreductase [Anaeromyxobacter sp.]
MLLAGDDVAVVTGATRGIGREIARALAREGARLLVTGRDGHRAGEVAAEIAAETGREAAGVALDLRSEEQVAAAVRACRERLGDPTVLVNNAGVYLSRPLLEMTRRDWEELFAVNVTGTFLMTREVGRIMSVRRRGRIVNISSCSARKADPGQAAYNASKSAIVGLTRVTALELGRQGVTCNAVLPGATDTEMIRSSFLTTPGAEREWIERTALKRLGRPEDVARVVLFLVSPLAGHVTGESIVVSGGELMTQ